MTLRNLKLRMLVRWLIHSTGVLIVLCAVIIGLAGTAWFRGVLQHQLTAGLERVTGGKVEIAGMYFHPLSLRVSVRRLVIHGLEKNATEPLFSAQHIEASISPESLPQFRLLLRSLQWQQAELRVQTYPDGSTNLPGATVSPGEGQGLTDLLDLGIERLTLSHTTLIWNNQRIPFQAAARDVAMQLQLSQDHNYRGSVAFSKSIFKWKSRTLPPLSLAATFKLSDQQVEVSGLSWQVENLRGHLAGALHWTPQLAANFEFRANGGLQELARSLKIAQVESGYLYVDGKGTYDSKGITVGGRLKTRDLKLKNPEIQSAAVNFTSDYGFAGGRLRIPNFTLTGLNASAEGDATVSLAKGRPQVVLRTRFKEMDLSTMDRVIPRLARTIGIFHPQAVISGMVSASWQQPSRLRSRFNLQFQPPEGQAVPGLPLTGHAQGTLDWGRKVLITLNDAQVSTPHSNMSFQGMLGDEQSSMSVKFATSDFEEWRPGAEILIETRNSLPITLQSQAVFNGTLSGTFSNPEISGQTSIGAFNYAGWLWDSFQSQMMFSPQHASIQSGRLKLGKSSLTLDAEVGLFGWKLEPNSSVRLKATAQETPVAGVRAALGLKPVMEGLVTGQVEAEGTVESLSGRGHISVRKGEFAGVPFDSVEANILATKSNWEIRNFKLVEGRGYANGNLQVNPVERAFSANLQGRDFPLGRIHFINPQAAETSTAAAVSGLVSFSLQGGGRFDNARLQSTVDMTNLAWKGQQLGTIHGKAEWQGQQVALQLAGGGAQAGNFQITGNLETRDNWPLHLSGQYAALRVDPWIQEFSGHSMAAEVSASGSFKLDGPLKEREKLSGSSRIDHLQVSFPALKLTNPEPVEVSYAGSILTLQRFRLQGQATNFEVGGSIHFGHPPSLDISAKGQAAATLLGLFASGLQATGESTLEVQLRGTPEDPQLSGQVQVKDVSLGYTDLPFRLNALNGTIKLEGERAMISSLKGTIGGGSVTIAGFLVLRESLRYQIRTELSQVRVRYPTDFTSVLDGNLTLAGTSNQGQLSGNIAVRNLFANENLNLVDLISGPNPFGGPLAANSGLFASSINLNVTVASVRPVRIESHDLRVVSDIDLQVQGTLANPVAIGNIYLRSGDAIFRGNRYTVTRGDISFSNPFRTEPVLDVQVRTTIDKYDLTLEISGPMDQVRLSYRSDPPLPTQDILSLLAFGYSKRLEEFAPEARSPFSTAGASALLSQALSSQVTGRIQRLFGVSRIKYSPTSAELGTLGGPVLTVEQQISPELTLTYETSTANSQYRVIEFEYTVNPRMSVRGFRDQNGIFGLELKFRKRFK